MCVCVCVCVCVCARVCVRKGYVRTNVCTTAAFYVLLCRVQNCHVRERITVSHVWERVTASHVRERITASLRTTYQIRSHDPRHHTNVRKATHIQKHTTQERDKYVLYRLPIIFVLFDLLIDLEVSGTGATASRDTPAVNQMKGGEGKGRVLAPSKHVAME